MRYGIHKSKIPDDSKPKSSKDNDNEQSFDVPEVSQLRSELKRVDHNANFRKLLRSTVYTLIVVAAVAVLVAVIFMPVIRIYGGSMRPTLSEGQIVVCVKYTDINQGDIVGAYYGSKLIIKRCIATADQWVDIKKDGNVYVDGKLLDEPYITAKAFGDNCNIEFPYQVPSNAVFLMGDERAGSVDSRNTAVGCIDLDNIVGKILFRVWPMGEIGTIDQN